MLLLLLLFLLPPLPLPSEPEEPPVAETRDGSVGDCGGWKGATSTAQRPPEAQLEPGAQPASALAAASCACARAVHDWRA